MTPKFLRAVGFWFDVTAPATLDPSELDSAEELARSLAQLELERKFPWPQTLVNHAWEAARRDRIGAYLRSGTVNAVQFGYSYCRFGLNASERNWCTPDSGMGCTTPNDGVWIWPIGLAHYVERHHVMLPDEFVAHMAQTDFVPLESDLCEHIADSDVEDRYGRAPNSVEVEHTYWIQWAAQNRQSSFMPPSWVR